MQNLINLKDLKKCSKNQWSKTYKKDHTKSNIINIFSFKEVYLGQVELWPVMALAPLCIATRNRFYLYFQNKLRNNEGTTSMAFHYPLYSDSVTSSRTKHHLELFKTMPNRTLFNRPPNLWHRSLVKTRHT